MRIFNRNGRSMTVALWFLLFAFGSTSTLRAGDECNRTLRQQLLKENSCELNFFTALRELEIKGHLVIEGRAHCKDKRLFNFIRQKPGSKFAITACKPDVC